MTCAAAWISVARAAARTAGAWIRHGVSKTERQVLLDKAYAYFPVLAERRNQPGGTLSGGEQQMLAIARAMML